MPRYAYKMPCSDCGLLEPLTYKMPRALSTTRSRLAWTSGEAKLSINWEWDPLSASTRNAWRQAEGAVVRLLLRSPKNSARA